MVPVRGADLQFGKKEVFGPQQDGLIISDGYPVIKRSSDRTLKTLSGGPFTIWHEYIVPRENKVVKDRK